MTRILIVDDDKANRAFLEALLTSHDVVVDCAHHGAEALHMARATPPDLVVSDLFMPVLDGYALLRQWKGDPTLAGIPFVVFTATYVHPEDERLALAMGADDFLIKPAEPEVLLARLGQVLAGSRLRTPSGTADGQQLLARYYEMLARKLDQRALQLEQSGRDLQDSEERYRATFEQASVGIANVDVYGRFLRVNEKFCDITGYARDELLRMDMTALTVPGDRATSEAARRAMLTDVLTSHAVDKRYLRKDGSIVWVNLSTRLLRDADGRPRYFISVVTDISDRMALEEQVRQAQKLEAVGLLTGGIAHDFNNLLTVIIGNSELLVEALAGNGQLRPLAEMTRTAARRGAELTQRLVAFARRQALDPRAVDVNGLLADMDRMVRRMLPETIQISLVYGQGLWPAMVDASQLESAVLNLCINARDAMPDGGRLTVETANVDVPHDASHDLAHLAPGGYVRVSVSDNGTGIPPEHIARVFDPFFTTKPAGKGTGLGLSMVYGFAKQSRGTASIQSALGRGTTVNLYLPRASDHELQAVVEVQAGEVDPRGGECILLVEDDEMVRRFAERLLADLGYKVLSAASGEEALAVVRSRADIDLLFTDVVMPGLDGPQLVQAALAARPGLKVLYASGYAEHALVHDGRLDAGVVLLDKPYGPRELAAKLRTALAVHRTPAAGAEGDPARSGRLLVLDDHPLVAKVLGLAAQKLGFKVELTHTAAAFLDRATSWAPTHVAIDLSMPGASGLQVLDQLAATGARPRVIIFSGAGASEVDPALDHARARGLPVAGALAKPFSMAALQDLLR